jgi:homocysteine S-methyltransferase
MKDFWERIGEEVLVADGAMGTMVYDRGVPKGHCYDELNLSNPELIKEIHGEYIAAGAELIETNTFGANEYVLGKYYGLADKAYEINVKGARIAQDMARRSVASKPVFVAGSIGPITRPLESTEKLTTSEIERVFELQISALAEGGVDIILFETMASLDELICGFKAAKRICGFPVICQLSFATDGRTIQGISPVEAGSSLADEGVRIMGTNCGIGLQSVYEAIKRMGHVTNAILSVQPNAGQASFSGSSRSFVYPASPDYFAEYAKKYVDAGVAIIGGCCGTTPAHIRAVREAIQHKRPKSRKIVDVSTRKSTVAVHSSRGIPETQLQSRLKQEFVLSLEIDPPKGTDCQKEIKAAQRFRQLGGDCVNISDNPMARLRMSPIPLAHLIQEKADIDIILHFTCRDRNLLGIQSDLIGAHAMGIQNILALTGDPPSVGDYPFATAVFEIRSDGLIEIMNLLNHGKDWLGNPVTQATSFFVGVASNLDDPEGARKKIEKGAGFVQTQPVFEMGTLKVFVDALKDTGVPVIAGVLVLASLRHARFIQNEVPGISIPDAIMKRMESGKENEGVAVAREVLQQMRGVCQGACIMLPFGKYDLVEQLLE